MPVTVLLDEVLCFRIREIINGNEMNKDLSQNIVQTKEEAFICVSTEPCISSTWRSMSQFRLG